MKPHSIVTKDQIPKFMERSCRLTSTQAITLANLRNVFCYRSHGQKLNFIESGMGDIPGLTCWHVYPTKACESESLDTAWLWQTAQSSQFSSALTSRSCEPSRAPTMKCSFICRRKEEIWTSLGEVNLRKFFKNPRLVCHLTFVFRFISHHNTLNNSLRKNV